MIGLMFQRSSNHFNPFSANTTKWSNTLRQLKGDGKNLKEDDLRIMFTSTSIFVGNIANGRISKRVFQENKSRQIFRKTNISYPLICTRTWVKKLACFIFLKHPYWDSLFCLFTDHFWIHNLTDLQSYVTVCTC